MKRVLILTLYLFLSLNIVFAEDNLTFLKNLIKNNYFITAKKFCKNIDNKSFKIKKVCLQLYDNLNDFSAIIKNLDLDEVDPDILLLYLKSSIKLRKYKLAEILIKKIDTLILTQEQKSKFNNLKNLLKANLYFENYDYASAIKYLLKLKDMDVSSKKTLVLSYIYIGDIKRAENLYKKFKLNDYFLIGLIEYKKGNYNQALLYFQKSNSKEAKDYIYNCLILTKKIDQAIKIYPFTENYKQKFYNNIVVLIKYKKYDEAILRLDNAENCFEKFFYLGKVFLKKRLFLEAYNNFLKADKLKDTSKINFYLGLTLFKKGEFINAVKFFEKSIDIQDSEEFYIKSIYFAGLCYKKIGDLNKATLFFKKIIAYTQNYIELKKIYKNLAQLEEENENYNKAVEYYNYLYLLSKNRKYLFKIGEIYFKTNQLQRALAIYENSLPVKKKQDSFILKSIGDIYFKANDFENSVKFYKMYISYNKKDYSVWLKIGLAYLYQNDLKRAKKEFLKIIELTKQETLKEEALYWVGLIFYREKKPLKSNIYFLRLYNLNPNSYLSLKAVKFIIENSFKLKDYDTLKKFLPLYKTKETLELIKNYCNDKNCLMLLTIKPSNEIRKELFSQIKIFLKRKKYKEIDNLIEKNRYELTSQPILYFKIAEILENTHAYKRAIFYYKKFLEFPYNSIYLFEFQKAYLSVVKYYLQNNDFEKIISLESKYKNFSLPNQYNFIMGKSFYKTGLTKKAKIYLSKFIENFSEGFDNLENLFTASFYLDNLGEYNYALKGYQLFIEKTKDKEKKVEALYWIGEIYFKEKKLFNALQYFLKIRYKFKEFSKWNIQSSFRAGNIFEMLGDNTSALKEYKYIYYRLPDGDPRKIYVKKKIEEIKGENSK